MVKDFVTYKVHIHKTNHEDLYRLLENMPKSTRGIYIREAIEHYARTNGLLAEKPKRKPWASRFEVPSMRTLAERYDHRHGSPNISLAGEREIISSSVIEPSSIFSKSTREITAHTD